ncbi:branched-chain amino acid ABC transporter permease [Desulfovibrio intestinalis]|uniref:Branched-chain amino acid transport system permease protein n=1 Tax=Desulfovibrio intestinalis TaxID=58621 RepID=A0A7W8C010_9BACT|nr:branched-chain amino acid ABC transporter permease [Desulfovibrio intestinalis]MBB5143092.1 branched-chain amino acid transport system permease protein [Desulfovibrio intestinalis]
MKTEPLRIAVRVALAAVICTLPLFSNAYWTDVCVSIGLYALLSLSLNVILGQSGIFHMGHAAFFAVGAYATAILNTLCQWPIFWTMPVAGAVAALFALLVARPIIHLRGDYLLIVTIGIVEIVRIALINDVFGLTGGANGIFGISRPSFFGFRVVKGIQFYYLVWGMVGVSLLLFYGLWHSRFGRALNYIKEDDVAAEGCGVNVTHYKLMAFVLGAFWAGMAGTLYAAKMTTISPESFSFMESVIIFAVVILSGGSQIGVLISAFLFIGLPELLREFSNARMLIFGLAMMVMMVWRPQGLLPPRRRRYHVGSLVENGSGGDSSGGSDAGAGSSGQLDDAAATGGEQATGGRPA